MAKDFLQFIKLVYRQRQLLMNMARRDAAIQHVGSLLGFIWTFIHPLALVFVFWFVFSVGFKIKPSHSVPFVVWLSAGMCAWFVFADIINKSSNVVISNTNLIKKTVFPSQLLPVTTIISSLITHTMFLIVLIGLILFQSMPVSFYYFQFIYYLFCMCVFAIGLSWMISAINVFIRDVGPIVGVLMQIGFWATPIFWDIQIMSPKIQLFLKINPMYYIIQGYRESFIYFLPFWRHPYQTLYFWAVSVVFFIVGAMIFRKLKPHFADVL